MSNWKWGICALALMAAVGTVNLGAYTVNDVKKKVASAEAAMKAFETSVKTETSREKLEELEEEMLDVLENANEAWDDVDNNNPAGALLAAGERKKLLDLFKRRDAAREILKSRISKGEVKNSSGGGNPLGTYKGLTNMQRE